MFSHIVTHVASRHCFRNYKCMRQFPEYLDWSIRFGNTKESIKRLGKCYFATEVEQLSSYYHFHPEFEEDFKVKIMNDMLITEDFLAQDEEKSLFEELEPYMKRLHYEFDHWDDAIHGYRETERLKWTTQNMKILQRVRESAFPPGTPQLSLVHVLDLSEKGVIKPHIDSVRFCGNTIAGLSLLSDSVMRLVHHERKNNVLDVLLKRRSMYIMKDFARYDFTHEILGPNCSKFKDKEVPRERRISIICRNSPSGDS